MRVVVDGAASSEANVLSGVPQGTVLSPLLFLCHINDLPDSVKSQVRLFADDCLLYRPIKTLKDKIALQEDLRNLEQWAKKWGMVFNAKKCYILSVNQKHSHFYELDNTILQQVKNSRYLGLTFSDDLKWNAHVNNTVKKANSTLGLIRRNFYHCPASTRKTAYIALVRSTLEYGAPIWDPSSKTEVDKLEQVQRRAARLLKTTTSLEPQVASQIC